MDGLQKWIFKGVKIFMRWGNMSFIFKSNHVDQGQPEREI